MFGHFVYQSSLLQLLYVIFAKTAALTINWACLQTKPSSTTRYTSCKIIKPHNQ